MVETIISNLQFLVEHNKHLDFVSVENSNHPKRYGPLLDADVVKEIVNQSGASFLLDVRHAFCASYKNTPAGL